MQKKQNMTFAQAAQSRLNEPNPFKINNNNQINLASQLIFGGKKYEDLKPSQQVKLFESLNNSSNFLTHQHNSIIDNDRKFMLTKKKMGLNQNAHEVSQEFKDLGYMTKNGRK